jgi:hypothetical protein
VADEDQATGSRAVAVQLATSAVFAARLGGQLAWFWLVHRRCDGLQLVRAYRPPDEVPILTGLWCPVHRMGIAV